MIRRRLGDALQRESRLPFSAGESFRKSGHPPTHDLGHERVEVQGVQPEETCYDSHVSSAVVVIASRSRQVAERGIG